MLKKIIITSDKAEEMSGMVEKMLHYGGKLMACLEELPEDDEKYPMGMREDDDDDDMGMRGGYGQRMGRRSSGRYSRY